MISPSLSLYRFMYLKNQRLLNAHAFTPVFSTPSFKIHQTNILLFVKIRQPQQESVVPTSRLGLAITKKKIKRANQRNRVKRLAREYFRLHPHQLIEAVDIAIIIKNFPVALSNADIVTQLEASFKQINNKLKQHFNKNPSV